MEIEEILLDDKDFSEAIKEAGLSKSLENYTQKISDQRVSSGIETFKKNTQTKNLTDSEKITNLENELKELKNGNLKSSLDNSIKASLKEAGLSEGFAKYIKVDKIEDIGSAVKDLNDNILGLKQSLIDEKLKGNEPPAKGQPGQGGDSTLKSYVESKNKGEQNSPFKGKITKEEGE